MIHLFYAETLKEKKDAVKFELSSKVIQEENLIKETLAQTQLIMSLKHMSAQQEVHINQLKSEYASIKQERNNEIEMYQHDVMRLFKNLILHIYFKLNNLIFNYFKDKTTSSSDSTKRGRKLFAQ